VREPSIQSGTVAIADPQALDLVELLTVMSEALGRQPRFIPLESRILAVGAGLLGLGREFERGMSSAVVDPAEAVISLGWRPVLGAREAWARDAEASRV
jgi:uncharacterized protein YbjT (DUF2867 family)